MYYCIIIVIQWAAVCGLCFTSFASIEGDRGDVEEEEKEMEEEVGGGGGGGGGR